MEMLTYGAQTIARQALTVYVMLEIGALAIRHFSMGISEGFDNSLRLAALNTILFTIASLAGMHFGGLDANLLGWAYIASLVFIGNAIGSLAQWWTPLSAIVGPRK